MKLMFRNQEIDIPNSQDSYYSFMQNWLSEMINVINSFDERIMKSSILDNVHFQVNWINELIDVVSSLAEDEADRINVDLSKEDFLYCTYFDDELLPDTVDFESLKEHWGFFEDELENEDDPRQLLFWEHTLCMYGGKYSYLVFETNPVLENGNFKLEFLHDVCLIAEYIFENTGRDMPQGIYHYSTKVLGKANPPEIDKVFEIYKKNIYNIEYLRILTVVILYYGTIRDLKELLIIAEYIGVKAVLVEYIQDIFWNSSCHCSIEIMGIDDENGFKDNEKRRKDVIDRYHKIGIITENGQLSISENYPEIIPYCNLEVFEEAAGILRNPRKKVRYIKEILWGIMPLDD